MKTEQRVINRVIKFRAWDAHNKEMIDPYCELKEHNHFWGEDLTNTHYVSPVAVMQFTGLVDKEGNEIYEWDLVKDSAPWVWTVRFGEIISDGIRYVGWYLEHPEREDFSGPFTSEDTSVLKIVGNTFQGLLPSTTTI